ncbi:MAG: P-type ATPase, partial [Flavisolibacter sp.]
MAIHRRKKYQFMDPALLTEALQHSFFKLHPRLMVKNPVMFTVELGTIVMFLVVMYTLITGDVSQGSLSYNLAIFIVLFFTVLFANFAEAIAEARGKAQAETLRKTRQDTAAKKVHMLGEVFMDDIQIVSSSQLQLGDHFVCEAGDLIPMDGEIVKGIATIDESAITGESAPVIREA